MLAARIKERPRNRASLGSFMGPPFLVSSSLSILQISDQRSHPSECQVFRESGRKAREEQKEQGIKPLVKEGCSWAPHS